MHGSWGVESQERPPGGGPGWWWAGLVLASFWEWEPRRPGPSPAQQCESSPYLSQGILCLPTKKPIPDHLRCGARPRCSACPASRAWASWRRGRTGAGPGAPGSTRLLPAAAWPRCRCREDVRRLSCQARRCLTGGVRPDAGAGSQRRPVRGTLAFPGLGREVKEEVELASQDRRVLMPALP